MAKYRKKPGQKPKRRKTRKPEKANLRGKGKVDLIRSGFHMDERMNWTLADVGRLFPGFFQHMEVPELINDDNKHSRATAS